MTKSKTPPSSGGSFTDKLLIRGVHLDLTPAIKAAATTKAERLFDHNDHIVRIRLDLEHDKTADVEHRFIVKGHIEIAGPDLIASVASDDAYKSLDLVIDKLDGLLRRRHGKRKEQRNHPHAVELGAELPKAQRK